MSQAQRQQRWIGRRVPVAEDVRFVQGRGRYINDIALPGLLEMGVLSAPVAHARILSLNVARAREVPGVVAVITGADLPEWMEPIPQELEIPQVRWYPLAMEKVRFAGEWVAAVVSTSRAAAEDAAELIDVTYEELEPVVDPELAALSTAPLLHEGHGSNVVWEETFEYGDVDGAFRSAEHTFEHRYRWNRHSGVPLETFGCVAEPKADGVLDIWASHQNPGIQQEMMDVLRRSSIRVNMDIDVGGSYGSKRGRKQMYLTAVAALMTGRPVKFIEDRLENMQAGDGHGPDRIYMARAACDHEGVVSAIDIRLLDDLGAYCGRGARQITKPLVALCGPYRIASVRYGGQGVLTCKTNQSPFRGAGQPPHNFVVERLIDGLARQLQLDPLEVRRRNYIHKEDFPYKTPTGALYDSGDYQQASEVGEQMADLARLRALQAAGREEGRMIGIGVAGTLDPGGSYADPEGVRVEVDERGRVVATIGFQSCGQSHESMVRQILCEELAVTPADVTVQRTHGKGGIVGAATTGNRMTLMLGGAVHTACVRVQTKLVTIASHALGAGAEGIVVHGTRYEVASAPDRALDLADLAHIAYRQRERLPAGMEPGIVEAAVYSGPGVAGTSGLPPIGQGGGMASYSFDFHVVAVEVDRATYQVRFLEYVVVHDCGRVLNPMVVDGFVFGGIGHGVGGALYERFQYDELGSLQAATFMDYLMPTVCEVPHVRLYTIETPSPWHPYGAKGTAEGAYMTAPAAIASAVEDALKPLGVMIDEIPITPTRLYEMCELQSGSSHVAPAAYRSEGSR